MISHSLMECSVPQISHRIWRESFPHVQGKLGKMVTQARVRHGSSHCLPKPFHVVGRNQKRIEAISGYLTGSSGTIELNTGQTKSHGFKKYIRHYFKLRR